MTKIVLTPNTFLWTKGKKGLLYNSASYKSIEFFVSTDAIKDLCEKLQNPDNLYCVDFEEKGLSVEFEKFVENVIRGGFGKIIASDQKVISMPPIGRVIHTKPELSYLFSVTFYVGGNCLENDYHRQIRFPVKSKKKLTSTQILDFTKGFFNNRKAQINIVISDFSEQTKKIITELINSKLKESLCFYIELSDKKSRTILEFCQKHRCKYIFICKGHKTSASSITLLQEYGDFHLIVSDKKSYKQWESVIGQNKIQNYYFVPLFIKDKMFFKEQIFLNKAEISSLKVSRQEIFLHQNINSNFFGNLYVMPNGEVYANTNFPKIGKITDDIHNLINNAMGKNQAWLYIRNKGECKRCLYCWLCPSISNYEFVV